ncbi:uncharacterized protein LOC110094857 [Dendrobium catenatum]|uniref:uncharacterized protein LOC110094857 n=1 Tax=Dendrobium catenatum TaxID=906689 RepID=UPI0010A0453D|nr:uncharacterized protein LOC110094857 [Dendrobium catenatum]
MELATQYFPPLSSPSSKGQPFVLHSGSYADNVSTPAVKSTNFPVSFVSPTPKLSFRGNDLLEGANFWNLSLVGYSIGPRPYYEQLLSAMKKVWSIKDLEIVWNGGPWFLLGKPFILQRWSLKFKPVRDENATIPIWIKTMDLPLALWTPLGISRIASFIGVPISVDTLTANHTRLTFSRSPAVLPNSTKDLSLPNLNLPMDVASSSEQSTPPSSIPPPKIPTANKFDSLQAYDAELPPLDYPPGNDDTADAELPSSSTTQISTDCSSSDRLHNSKVKSKSPKEVKKVKPETSKKAKDPIINDLAQVGQSCCFFYPLFLFLSTHPWFLLLGAASFELSVVYASNNVNDRKVLWDDIRNVAPSIDLPWIILGDFNCYRFDYEKAGGNNPTQSSLGELYKCVFNCGLQDLASVGLFYTWFNQRVDMTIHIKLDRMMIPKDLVQAFSKRHENSPISDFYQSLRHLKNALKKKNWSSSNFLSNAIKDLKYSQNCCLEEIQSNPLNPVLNNSLKEINEQLANIQSAWSAWISQRAKTYWLLKGEDDLDFLFAKIKARSNRNFLREITTENGSFTTHSNISLAITNHFKVLFNSPISMGWEDVHIPVGKTVPAELYPMLLNLVMDEEIKKVVFSGKSDAAPGPDGYSFEFYKKTWHVIGSIFCRAVKWFFSNAYLLRATKATAIALIPKNTHASHISDYRPISLCNVFYKVVAKLLANRLKEVLPLIIHESQVGFIGKRCASDNVILAAELLREFNANIKFFCAKLDIRKAFDSLSREFLLHRLKLKGFPDHFIKLIKCCIFDVYFSISINGSLEGFFKSSSGLRQGCPLSPLLFCIAMDGLSHCLHPNIFQGITCNGVSVNHLMYADDLLVFGKAEHDNAQFLLLSLNRFAEASNLAVNPTKSSIIFSKNVTAPSLIADLLGIQNTNVLLTYLGLPISPSRLKFSHFQPLMSKISALLAGWKVKFLSFAGRLQFLKYTIADTIAYWIRGAIIHKRCRTLISKLCSKFLLHGDTEAKKMHLIAWNSITKPKIHGGLGIHSFDALYFGTAASFIWKIYNVDNLVGKWFRANFLSPWKSAPPSSSNFWKMICTHALGFKHYFSFFIGPNSRFSFLWDPWFNGKLLGDFISDIRLSSAVVGNFISDGAWCLPDAFPLEIKTEILNIAIFEEPVIMWDGTSMPTFKDFTSKFYSNLVLVDWHDFVWFKKASLKFACYTWMALIGKLKCANTLIRIGINVTADCSFCKSHRETLQHLFFECDFSFSVLLLILPIFMEFLFRPNLFLAFDWLNTTFSYSVVEKNFCFSVLACAIYHIWRERNNRRFSNSWMSPYGVIESIKSIIKVKVKHWKNIDGIKHKYAEFF